MAEFTAAHLAELLKHAVAITARNPDGHLTTDDFTGHQKMKLFFSRTASLYDFQRDPDLSIYRQDPGAEHVFQRITGLHPDTREPIREGDLSKGIIMNMRLVRLDNNFPVDIGFNVSGVHGTTADARGNTYAFVAPKNKSREPAAELFYEPKSKITRELLARFNDTNPEKLRAGTYIKESSPIAAVDNKCLIADMIRLNAASLGIDRDLLPPEGQEGFFAMDKRVIESCFAAYEEEQKIGFHDMRNFELTLTRVDSPKDWAKPEGVCDNIMRRNPKTDLQHADNSRLVNKYTISGEIEIELNLFGTGAGEGQ